MSEFILKAENISRFYPSGDTTLKVLKSVDIEVKEGEMLALTGQSGAGKSTLLHILGGLDAPSEGKVFLGGNDIYKLNDSKRAALRNSRIGFIFQFFHLLPEFTALENIMIPVLLSGRRAAAKKDLIKRARSLIEQIGLSSREKHKPSELSGGEQQRVAIARALINKPELVLCDEPTGNLDSENSTKVIKLLKELNKNNGQTFMIVSHDISVAEAGDRIIKIDDGRIVY